MRKLLDIPAYIGIGALIIGAILIDELWDKGKDWLLQFGIAVTALSIYAALRY